MADEGDERDAVYVGYQERRTAGKKGKVLEYYLVEEGAQKKRTRMEDVEPTEFGDCKLTTTGDTCRGGRTERRCTDHE